MQKLTYNENSYHNEYMAKAFKTIYTLLNRLEKALDYENFDAEEQIGYKALGITETRWRSYIEMLEEAEYISGVKIKILQMVALILISQLYALHCKDCSI